MSDATDAPTTTGRRTWVLTWRLALPWVVCGGLLWALVGLTPGLSSTVAAPGVSQLPGLSAEIDADNAHTVHPAELFVAWNGPLRRESSAGSTHRTSAGTPAWLWMWGGVSWVRGDSPLGRWDIVQISLWYLLPFPLLWSGFSLWRWTRRAK